jgi:hypothetical protein
MVEHPFGSTRRKEYQALSNIKMRKTMLLQPQQT